MTSRRNLRLLIALLPSVALAQERFAAPDAAAKALVAAAAKHDMPGIITILGANGHDIIASGDAIDDEAAVNRFASAAKERVRVEPLSDGQTAILHLGREDWPFAIPITRDGNAWRFDTAAGREELINRRVGRNEITTITVMRTLVDAQSEYAGRFGAYAQKLRSTAGAKDGLYWDDPAGKDPSPMGPLIATASAEGYTPGATEGQPAPYHGYLYRLLTSQGASAPGGAKAYTKDGKLAAGFAFVAWPAEHGSSGVMTFLVNHQGVVFQKDLGRQTDTLASGMTTYDPDRTWEPTR